MLNNKYMAKRIEQMRVDIERGENLTEWRINGLFTPLVQMISVGDQTGRVAPADVVNFMKVTLSTNLKH